MGKMVSMKKTDKDIKAEEKLYKEDMPREIYPYGLNISLDDASIKKLGIKEMPKLKETMTITAKVEVTRANLEKMPGGDKMSMGLQITEMGISE